MRIQLLTAVTVTLDDTGTPRTVPLTMQPCEYCPDGGQVHKGASTEYEDHIGHLRVGRIGRSGYAAMVSGGCPGDVRLSTAHGILRRATSESEALTQGLRSLARLTD